MARTRQQTGDPRADPGRGQETRLVILMSLIHFSLRDSGPFPAPQRGEIPSTTDRSRRPCRDAVSSCLILALLDSQSPLPVFKLICLDRYCTIKGASQGNPWLLFVRSLRTEHGVSHDLTPWRSDEEDRSTRHASFRVRLGTTSSGFIHLVSVGASTANGDLRRIGKNR
jgi:hypothetical protein